MKKVHFTLCSIVAVSAALFVTSCSGEKGSLAPMAGETAVANSTAAQLVQQAKAAENAGNTGAAAKLYKRTFKKYPHSIEANDARYGYAQLKQREGELLDSFEGYQAFIDRAPTDSRYQKALAEQSKVAQMAAKGLITNNFLGLKTRVDPNRTEGMLRSVIRNAPRSQAAAEAQFLIGDMWQSRGEARKALAAFRKTALDYPSSRDASEAQYRVGMILVRQAEGGNQDTANIAAAREAFQDYQAAYPGGPRAKEVREQLNSLARADIEHSFDIARFYEKKGQIESAKFYYREVIRQASGPLKARAQARLNALGQ